LEGPNITPLDTQAQRSFIAIPGYILRQVFAQTKLHRTVVYLDSGKNWHHPSVHRPSLAG
jgi:hypothetical protein